MYPKPTDGLPGLPGGDSLFAPALQTAQALLRAGGPALLAIDGRCGSGKTSLAALLQSRLGGCNVFHMDDFYLPFAARAEGWQDTPGGNMDFARLVREVLQPVRAGQGGVYTAFDCHSGLMRNVRFAPQPLAIVEGSYALMPVLAGYYDASIFLTCAPEVQAQRLLAREGPEGLARFRQRWIPLEERYFAAYDIPPSAGLCIDTGRALSIDEKENSV